MRNAMQRLGWICVAGFQPASLKQAKSPHLNRPRTWIFVAVLTLALTMTAATVKADAPIDPGDAALAQRLADTARLTLSVRTITTAHFKMAGALLEAAVKLDPTEPRYSRLWADAMLQVLANTSARDPQAAVAATNGAIKALNAYVLYEPEDKPALIQLTDLHANAFETIDKRLDYLRDWVDDTRLPEEVRSHIAMQAYLAYVERSQLPQAKNMLDEALKLNPLNLEALKVRFDQVSTDGTPYERVLTLLAILKSNPNQVQYAARLAQQLAAAGLAQQALQFYALSFNLANRQAIPIPRDLAMAYAVELVLINQLAPAKQLADSLVTSDPNDYDAIALRLLIERGTDQKDATAKSMERMQNVLLNRLQTIRQKLGDKGAATRPVDSAPAAWGSFDADIKLLKEMKEGETAPLRTSYAEMLTHIAWFETYFRQSPADAKPVIDALKQLLPENNADLARLEGWGFLLRGEKDQANVKLSAIKDTDEIAAVGLIRMMDSTASQKEGEKLLSKHPVGLSGILILDALRDRKVALTPNPDLAGPITEALAKFPMAWLAIVDQPQTFYTLSAEPLKIAHTFGEPMLVRATIKNISDYPITLGPEGILHPDLWFDAEFRGVVQQMIPGAAYDRIGHEVVLKPHTSVSQVVRIDQGAVAQNLTASPFPAMQINLRVRTNPSTTGASGVGPAGQIVAANKFIDRREFPFAPASLQKLSQDLQQGGPAEKIVRTDLAATIAVILSQQKDDSMHRTALQLVELLKAATRDSSPAVAAWAGGTLARISPATDRTTAVSQLINDPYWVARLLGLVAMGPMKLEEQRVNAQNVAVHDTDSIVVAYAKALDELLQTAIAAQAATQASTQPTATQPTTDPTSPFGPSPTAPPTTKPAGPDIIIPSLPLTLPPPTPPTDKP